MFSNKLICNILRFIDDNINRKISICEFEECFFYNRYYINKMVELENKLENGFTPSATALILYKDNLFKSLVKNIKTLFKLSNKDVSTVTNNK